MISALRQQGGPSPLWNGARRFYGPRPGRQDNVIPLSESQAKISVRPTVVRLNRLSGGSAPQNTFFILIGITDGFGSTPPVGSMSSGVSPRMA